MSFIFWRLEKSNHADMSGVGVFLHACPVDFSTAVTAAAAPKARFSHDPSFFFSFLWSATHMLSSLPSAVTADLNNKSLLKYFVYQNLKKTEVLKKPREEVCNVFTTELNVRLCE